MDIDGHGIVIGGVLGVEDIEHAVLVAVCLREDIGVGGVQNPLAAIDNELVLVVTCLHIGDGHGPNTVSILGHGICGGAPTIERACHADAGGVGVFIVEGNGSAIHHGADHHAEGLVQNRTISLDPLLHIGSDLAQGQVGSLVAAIVYIIIEDEVEGSTSFHLKGIGVEAISILLHRLAGPAAQQCVLGCIPNIEANCVPALGIGKVQGHREGAFGLGIRSGIGLHRRRHRCSDLLCSGVKGNGNGLAVFGHGQIIVTTGPSLVPGTIQHNFKFVSTSSHIGINLFIGAVGLLHHIVGRVVDIPFCAAQTGCASHGKGSIHKGMSAPGGSCSIPRATRQGKQILTIGGNLQVAGLIPLIIPVVGGSRRIHTDENHIGIGVIGGNHHFINAVEIHIGHADPNVLIRTVIEEVGRKAGTILEPVGVRLQVQILRHATYCANVIGIAMLTGFAANTANTIAPAMTCRIGLVAGIAVAASAAIGGIAALGAGGLGHNGSIGMDVAPSSAALIPGAFLNRIHIIVIGRNSKISGLIPLIVPVVGTGTAVHTAEDDVGISGRNNALVNTIAIRIGHACPITAAIIPIIDSKASAIFFPIAVRLQIQRCCCIRSQSGHGQHGQDHGKHHDHAQQPF